MRPRKGLVVFLVVFACALFVVGLMTMPSGSSELQQPSGATVNSVRPSVQQRLVAPKIGAALENVKPSTRVPVGPTCDLRFAVVVIALPGYAHTQVFSEVALTVYHGLLAAQHDCILVDPLLVHPNAGAPLPAILEGRILIVFGSNVLATAQTIEATKKTFPTDRTVLYNLEQVTSKKQSDWHWITGNFLTLLKAYRVWDHMQENVDSLRAMGVEALDVVEIGYTPSLSRVHPLVEAEQDIDVLFLGTVSDYRYGIIDALQNTGFRVEPPPRTPPPLPQNAPLVVIRGGDNHAYGEERDKLIARSKIILNPQLNPGAESREFKWVRLFYLLANNKFVLGERAFSDMEEHFLPGLAFCTAEEFPSAIRKWLNNASGRAMVARRGMKLFQAKDATHSISRAVNKLMAVFCGNATVQNS